jgi:hypothetical protein
MRSRTSVLLPLLLLSLATAGCKLARDKYYGALEKVGIEKRELLVSRVDKAREAQVEAQQQFKDALEEFQALVGYSGGDLEKMYGKVSAEYEASARQAAEVKDRIAKVEHVAQSLFAEWRTEIGQYRDAALRRESERELALTEQRYRQVLSAMQRSAKTMDPVLGKLHDQVLFLKHNLNARALGSLAGTAKSLELEVGGLIEQMQLSIAEADRFIAEMKGGAGG